MGKRSNSIDMCSGPLFRDILRFFIPFVLTGFLQRLYHAADVLVVGRYAGEAAIAGVGTTGSLSSMIIDMAVGLSAGVSVALGHAIGAKDEETASRVVHTAIAISLISGFVVSVVGIFFATPLLTLIDVPHNVMPQAEAYMRIVFLGKVPVMVYTFGAAVLRAKGDSKRPMYIITVSGLLNVVLNLFFVLVCKMEAAGVALATVIAQVYNAVAIVYLLRREEGPLKLNFKKIKVYGNQFMDILRVGVPTGLQSLVFSFSNVIIQTSVNGFGSAAIAGNTAAQNVGGFFYNCFNSFTQTAIVFVSQNVGAKNYKRVGKTVRYCFFDVTVIWGLVALVAVFGGEFLLKFFLPDNPEALAKGLIRLIIMGCTYGIQGYMLVFTGALRGMGYSVSSMLISVFGACGIRILWILTVFKHFKTFETLFLSYAVSWLVSSIFLGILYMYAKRKQVRQL